jgi:3-phenylpropionate/trans-cinnamate dioxygenase ferredoxin component
MTWVRACEVDDVDPEDVVPFEHGGEHYAVYRSPDEEFFATAAHCTHERELLCDGLVMDSLIECPSTTAASTTAPARPWARR